VLFKENSVDSMSSCTVQPLMVKVNCLYAANARLQVDVNELANGNTPLDSALASGNDATVELLRSKGGRTAGDIAVDKEL
jgi:ankyrin repeat protein